MPSTINQTLKIMKYYVSVTETLNKVVSVEADNEQEAKRLVDEAYSNSEIVLDSDCFCGSQIDIEDDQEFYRTNEELYSVYQEIKPNRGE